MPPKHGTHQLTKYPNICRRYSGKKKQWLYGFRIELADASWVHLHKFDELQDARDAVTEIRQRERNAKYGLAPARNGIQLSDLVDKHLLNIERRAERVRATRVFSTWMSLLPDSIEVSQITSATIRLYVEQRQQDRQAASSINRELNIIAAALNAAASYFGELEQWRAPKMPRPKVTQSRRERLITDNEYRKILDWLERDPDERDATRRSDQKNAYNARLRVAAIFKFAMSTGMRPNEIYKLKWTDVDFTGRMLKVYTGKGDKYRYVPISEPVAAILYEQATKEKRDFVFTQGGNPTPKIYRILRDAVEGVGIQYGRKVKDGFELYCARHTFTTRLLQAGLDLRTVASITGHSDREMVLHYSHVTPESTARAVVAIEAIEMGRRKVGER